MKIPHIKSLAIAAGIALTAITSTVCAEADSVFLNARAYTLNSEQPWAQAVAIRDGVFVAVGTIIRVNLVVGVGRRDRTQVPALPFAVEGDRDARTRSKCPKQQLVGVGTRIGSIELDGLVCVPDMAAVS